jgi:hypothetical protein
VTRLGTSNAIQIQNAKAVDGKSRVSPRSQNRKANVKTKTIKTKLTCFLLYEINYPLRICSCTKRPIKCRSVYSREFVERGQTLSGKVNFASWECALPRSTSVSDFAPPPKYQCRTVVLARFGPRQLYYVAQTKNLQDGVSFGNSWWYSDNSERIFTQLFSTMFAGMKIYRHYFTEWARLCQTS